MVKRSIALSLTAVIAEIFFSGPSQAQVRSQISIVGSGTVFPFAATVAERFGKSGKFKTPKVEETGTGGGMKLFCGGVGPKFPDVTNASRRMKASEAKLCTDNGVRKIVEVKIGYDGIVIAHSKSKPNFALTTKQLYLAMTARLPSGKPNPYKSWSEIDKSLPNEAIELIGPPIVSGTRDAFLELVMKPGCAAASAPVAALEKTEEAKWKSLCQSLREDGKYVIGGENYNLTVQKLVANPQAVGLFGFSYLDQNADKIVASPINGVPATYDTIASGKYPVSRPLFFYVKKQHIGAIPGLKEYVSTWDNDAVWGTDGILVEKGLIAMPVSERQSSAAAINALTELDFSKLK